MGQSLQPPTEAPIRIAPTLRLAKRGQQVASVAAYSQACLAALTSIAVREKVADRHPPPLISKETVTAGLAPSLIAVSALFHEWDRTLACEQQEEAMRAEGATKALL